MMRALVVARAKEAKQRRKRGDFESVEFGDLDDGLSGKKNSTSSPLFCSLSLCLSFFRTPSGVHLAARVRGPRLDLAGPAKVPGPRRQSAPLGAAGEERSRAESADDGGRRKGGAEETRERGKVKEKSVEAIFLPLLLFASSFLSTLYIIRRTVRLGKMT